MGKSSSELPGELLPGNGLYQILERLRGCRYSRPGALLLGMRVRGQHKRGRHQGKGNRIEAKGASPLLFVARVLLDWTDAQPMPAPT
jgi:hypothetical protein